jgi:hypothetical protein
MPESQNFGRTIHQPDLGSVDWRPGGVKGALGLGTDGFRCEPPLTSTVAMGLGSGEGADQRACFRKIRRNNNMSCFLESVR